MISLSIFAAGSCSLNGGNLLGFPKWYEYLSGTPDANGTCIPSVSGLNDVWLIVAAIIEILLRIAALLAVAYVIYGGVQYIMSNGDPDKASKARSSIINALVGLAITVLSSVVITFIANSIK